MITQQQVERERKELTSKMQQAIRERDRLMKLVEAEEGRAHGYKLDLASLERDAESYFSVKIKE